MQVVQERLEREFNLDLIATTPNVRYKLKLADGRELEIDNPAHWPEDTKILKVYEPVVKANIITPAEYLGPIIKLIQNRRGQVMHTETLGNSVRLETIIPLTELIVDFYDMLKSASRGYASLDYDFYGYQESDMIKLNILIHGQVVDSLSLIVHRDKAYWTGRQVVSKLKELIPRQLFEFKIQAAIGRKVIASVTVKPLRRDVLAKCYGGDVTRKKKLLEKQKRGKKRMKAIGKVNVPQEAFWALLKVSSSSEEQR